MSTCTLLATDRGDRDGMHGCVARLWGQSQAVQAVHLAGACVQCLPYTYICMIYSVM